MATLGCPVRMDKLREQLADGKITSLFQHNASYNRCIWYP